MTNQSIQLSSSSHNNALLAYHFQPVVMHLACIMFKMSMNEALVAATINAAASLGRAHLQGSIEVGKMADLVLLDADR